VQCGSVATKQLVAAIPESAHCHVLTGERESKTAGRLLASANGFIKDARKPPATGAEPAHWSAPARDARREVAGYCRGVRPFVKTGLLNPIARFLRCRRRSTASAVMRLESIRQKETFPKEHHILSVRAPHATQNAREFLLPLLRAGLTCARFADVGAASNGRGFCSCRAYPANAQVVVCGWREKSRAAKEYTHR